MVDARQFVAARTAAWAKSDYTAKDYVQEGLTFQWDGIENVGYGLPHDPNARKWNELINGVENFTISSPGSHFEGGNHLYSAGDRYCAAYIQNTAIAKNDVVFLETVFEVYEKKSSLTYPSVVSFANGIGPNVRTEDIVYKHDGSSGKRFYDENPYSLKQVAFYFSGGEAYKNGMSVASANISYTLNSGVASIFGNDLYPTRTPDAYTSSGSGVIYAIRIYNRALTAEEVYKNYAIDKARFGLT